MHKEYSQYPYESTKVNFETDHYNASLINECLSKTSGVALEVGGPTEKGYQLLKMVNFPNKLVISNAYPETDEIAKVDITKEIPFPNKSLGCVISSFLPIVDLANPLRDAREIKIVLRETKLLAEKMIDGVCDDFCSDGLVKVSPRLSFIREAYRVLEDDGILLIKGLTMSELKILDKLGFREVASAECSYINNPDNMWIQKEYAFCLNRLNDGSAIGKFVLDRINNQKM